MAAVRIDDFMILWGGERRTDPAKVVSDDPHSASF
jgi:hypothetical protein